MVADDSCEMSSLIFPEKKNQNIVGYNSDGALKYNYIFYQL